MRSIIHGIQRNASKIYKVLLFLISVVIIVYLFPRQVSFQYEFSQGRPWLDDDLIAPFDFAIQKAEEEIKAEEEKILVDFLPFFTYNKLINDSLFEKVMANYDYNWQKKYDPSYFNEQRKKRNLEVLTTLFDTVFKQGIVFLPISFHDVSDDFSVRLVRNQVAEVTLLSDIHTIAQASDFIEEEVVKYKNVDTELLKNILHRALAHNVFFDEDLTKKAKESAIENISPNRGMIQQGEKIVSKGELITAEKYIILDSFRAEYNKQIGDSTGNVYILLGQIILVSIPIIVLVLFLKNFRKYIFEDNRKITLILLTIFMMVFFTSLVLKYDINLLYIVPVCILPIMMKAFFDNRLALYIHIITIILIGFLVPRSFEFVFIQFVGGIIAIFSLVSLRKRSQLFIAVGWIILSYFTIYFGLNLVQGIMPSEMDLMVFARFGISGILTLFAYPLIFSFERIFGLPTDFSLLELADINSPLLRELSYKAPGTFQHSLQVANLAEEVTFAIGGNSLLVRTGSLYHDIGKLNNPLFFIENQQSEYNPHDDLTNQESAEIIINHVIKGIEKGRKHKLPEYIIDFIRTHHGTTMVKYFYSTEVNNNPDKDIEQSDYQYKGPKPFSKETAVVMMADAVEAASRSLKNPDEENINDLVENIINSQVEEKQFENANITFKDISQVKRIFKRRLLNIFHVRISYPEIKNSQ